MNREQFDDLVRRVAQDIGKRPAALRWKVAWLAGLGYAGLLAWLAIILAVAAAFIAVMPWVETEGKIICGVAAALVMVGGGYAALKVLLVRVPPPEGRTVTRAEAPELFRVLDELQTQLRSASFHRVLVEPVCNAGVVQIPRLGVFGWQRNYLLLGLPLLEALSRDEVRAVLAHEFAHLSRDHGRFSHRIYRLRRSWEEVFKQLSAPQVRGEVSLRPLVVKYVDWFWPRFNAHAFVLSRTDEYEADSQSARLTGKEFAGLALMRLEILQRHLDEQFWPDLWELANRQPEPPGDTFVRLRDAIRAGPSPEKCAEWRAAALRVTTTNSDTHPCLTERLRALQIADAATIEKLAADKSAAEEFLGPALETIRQDVQLLWRKQAEAHWKDRHARAASLFHRLESLEQAVPDLAADADGLWDKVALTLDLQGGRNARPLLEQILALRPDHVPARFHLGRLLLEDGSAEGEVHLERAMQLDDEVVPRACALLHDHYRQTGQTEKLRAVAVRLDGYEKDLAASYAERREITAKDTLVAHGLSEADLRALQETFQAEPGLARATLGQKQLRHFPKQKFFVLCVYRRRPWHRLPNSEADQALVNRLLPKIRLPGRMLVFPPTGGFRGLARNLEKVPHAEVWPRA